MLLAPPIVSHAYIFLTRFLSFSIFYVEKARESVTERGSPSGIATTITVIPIIKNLISSTTFSPLKDSSSILSAVKRAHRIIMIKMAEYKPNLPISSAIDSNFSYNGLLLSS